MIPGHSRYVIIGAGIHGLSTAWHLAAELRRRGLGGGEDILVLDKRGVGAGASGIACGVIRNNYFQPAMRELMAHSVVGLGVRSRARSPTTRSATCRSPRRRCARTSRRSTPSSRRSATPRCSSRGSANAATYMLGDVRRLAGARHHRDPARAAGRLRQQRPLAARPGGQGRGRGGADRHRGHRHRDPHQRRRGDGGGDRPGGDRLRAAGDRRRPVGPRPVGHAGPAVTHPGDHATDRSTMDQPMWTYWALQEGTLAVDPGEFTTNDGAPPPVLHVDSAAPLYDDHTGEPHHRPDVGDLLQAGLLLRRGPGRHLALRRRQPAARGRRRSLRPGEPRVHGDR